MADPNEYVIPIGGDVSPLVAAIDKSIEKIEQFEAAANKATQVTNTAFVEMAKPVRNAETAIKDVTREMAGQTQTAGDLNKQLKQTATATKEGFNEKPVDRFAQFVDKAKQAHARYLETVVSNNRQVVKSAKDIQDSFGYIASSANVSQARIEDLIEDIKQNLFTEKDINVVRQYNAQIQALEARLERLKNTGKAGYDRAGNPLAQAATPNVPTPPTPTNPNDDPEKKTKGLLSSLKPVGAAIAAYFAVDKIKEFGKEVVDLTAKYERFGAVLKNALGSNSAAQDAIDMLSHFAATTPFQIDEVTEAFIKLVNRGFKPTQGELTNLGDLAASQGKSLDQLVEALLDAQTGEFERLKEFGIRAQQVGDKVKLSFKGQTVEVAKNTEAIKEAILGFGKLQGVAGGMATVSETLTGKLSNLSDSYEQFMSNLGKGNSGIINTAVDYLGQFVGKLNEYTKTPVAEKLQEEQTEINGLINAIISANGQRDLQNSLITTLNQKYPELLGNIDTEYLSSKQLKDLLVDINKEYNQRINLAIKAANADQFAQQKTDALKNLSKGSSDLFAGASALGVKVDGKYNLSDPKDIERLGNDVQKAYLDFQKKASAAAQRVSEAQSIKGAKPASKEDLQIVQQMQEVYARISKTDLRGGLFGIGEKTFADIAKESTENLVQYNAAVKNFDDANKDLKTTQDQANEDAKKTIAADQLVIDSSKKKRAELEAQNKASFEANAKLAGAKIKYDPATDPALKEFDNDIALKQAQIKRLNDQLGVAPKAEGTNFGKTNVTSAEALANKEKAAENARVKNRQEANDRLLKLVSDLHDAETGSIDDTTKKAIQAAKDQLTAKTAELDAQEQKIKDDNSKNKGKQSDDEINANTQALQTINKLRLQLVKNEADAEQKINNDAAKKKLEQQLSYDAELTSLQDDSLEKQLEQIENSAAQKKLKIEKDYEGQADLIKKLQDAVDEAAGRQTSQVRNDDSLKRLNNEEALQTSILQLAQTYGDKRYETEEEKQKQLLELQIKFAKQRLDLLRASGKEEDKAQADQLEQTIKGLEGQLTQSQNTFKTQGKPIQGHDITNLLGINADPGVIDNYGRQLKFVAQQTDAFLNQALDSYVAAKQKRVDVLNDQINEVQGELEKEQELQKAGYANNVDAKQKEVDALKAKRDDELNHLKAAQKAKAALQRAELVTDSIQQVNDLITASASIFKSFAKIPVIGVPLAIAAIGTMFGAFAFAKVSAYKAAGQASQYGEGGEIDGVSHAQGGKKYYSSTGDVTELEQGEFVTKKVQYNKYKSIVQAINEDDFSSINTSDLSLQRMLSEMNISLSNDDEIAEANEDFAAVQQVKVNVVNLTPNNPDTGTLKSIDENIKYLADRRRNDEVWSENETHIIRTRGNRTTYFKK